MQINKIVNCNKPERFIGFTNNNTDIAEKKNKKIKYKHFEQLSDDALQVRSLLKAHNEVAKSGKMRVYKAMPDLTAILAGASIALTQPGKLASKAKLGLGFLALKVGMDCLSDKISPLIDKKYENKEKTDRNELKKLGEKIAVVTLGAIGATLGAVAIAKKAPKIKALEPLVKFANAESEKFSQEINNSRLGKFFENKVSPFTKKHSKLTTVASNVAPIGTILLGTMAGIKVEDSLIDDFYTKAQDNYTKGKYIQQKAREHFETIDAKEV